ncbi:unnamed protein product [Prunus armeniaca]
MARRYPYTWPTKNLSKPTLCKHRFTTTTSVGLSSPATMRAADQLGQRLRKCWSWVPRMFDRIRRAKY